MSAARIFRNSLIVICILSSFASLQADGIRFLAWDDNIASRKIGFQNGVEVTEIQKLHPDKRTDAVKWTSSEVPPQLIALDRTNPDGQPAGIPLKIKAGMDKPLILILPDPKHPTGLRGFVIEDGSDNFKWGAFRFINATGKELLVRNDKLVKAIPKTWQPVDLDPGGAMRNMAVQMAARDDLKAILYSAVWEYDPNIRKLIIVVPGAEADRGSLAVKVISEDRRTISTTSPDTPTTAP